MLKMNVRDMSCQSCTRSNRDRGQAGGSERQDQCRLTLKIVSVHSHAPNEMIEEAIAEAGFQNEKMAP